MVGFTLAGILSHRRAKPQFLSYSFREQAMLALFSVPSECEIVTPR